MKKNNRNGLRSRGFEFLSIFIAVISAFALNNWNDNRKDAHSENKILIEIYNGLEKDLDDIRLNVRGHEQGIAACDYFRKAFTGNDVNRDSIMIHYFNLTRDYINAQNISGYETLKSKGLELIKNDSLRLKIISLYEYDYNTLRKFEEEYFEMQYHENYFKELNEQIAPNFSLDSIGNISGVDLPLSIEEKSKNKLILYLWKIQTNRVFLLQYYTEIEKRIEEVRENIKNEIKQ